MGLRAAGELCALPPTVRIPPCPMIPSQHFLICLLFPQGNSLQAAVGRPASGQGRAGAAVL